MAKPLRLAWRKGGMGPAGAARGADLAAGGSPDAGPARFPVEVIATGGARELDRSSGAPLGFVFLRLLVRLSIWHNLILAGKARLRHYYLR